MFGSPKVTINTDVPFSFGNFKALVANLVFKKVSLGNSKVPHNGH